MEAQTVQDTQYSYSLSSVSPQRDRGETEEIDKQNNQTRSKIHQKLYKVAEALMQLIIIIAKLTHHN